MNPRLAPAALAATLALLCTVSCRYPATQVLVSVGTDAPPERRFDLRVTARASDGSAGSVHALARPDDGGGARAGSLGSFAVLPPAGRPLSSPVTLELEATLAAAGPSQPAQRWRRTVRFAFVERTALSVRVFLPVYCGNRAEGCASVPAEACTVSVRCEEQGLTCGDRGACVPPDVTPKVPDAGAPPPDAAPDDCATPAVADPTTLADFEDRAVPAAGPRPVGFSPASLARVSVIEGGAAGTAAAGRVEADFAPLALRGAATRQYLGGGGDAPDPTRGEAIEFYIRAPAGSPILDAAPGARSLQLEALHWRPGDAAVGTISHSAMQNFAYVSLDPAGADRWLRVVLGPAAFTESYAYYHFLSAAAGAQELPFVATVRELVFRTQGAASRPSFDLDEVRLVALPAVARVCPAYHAEQFAAADRDVLVPVELHNPTPRARTYRVYLSSVMHVAREDLLRAFAADNGSVTAFSLADRVGTDGSRLVAELFEAGAGGAPTGPSITVAGGAGVEVPAGGAFRGVVVHHVRAAMLGAPDTATYGTTVITARRDTLTTSMVVWDPDEPGRASPEVRPAGSNADDPRMGPAVPGFPAPVPRPPLGWTSREVPLDQGVGTFVSVIRLLP